MILKKDDLEKAAQKNFRYMYKIYMKTPEQLKRWMRRPERKKELELFRNQYGINEDIDHIDRFIKKEDTMATAKKPVNKKPVAKKPVVKKK
jgi:c-di-GMP-related signal transduction protein